VQVLARAIREASVIEKIQRQNEGKTLYLEQLISLNQYNSQRWK
jgi:hypothetical protein